MRTDLYIARVLEQANQQPELKLEPNSPSQILATVWPTLFFVAVVSYSIVEAFVP